MLLDSISQLFERCCIVSVMFQIIFLSFSHVITLVCFFIRKISVSSSITISDIKSPFSQHNKICRTYLNQKIVKCVLIDRKFTFHWAYKKGYQCIWSLGKWSSHRNMDWVIQGFSTWGYAHLWGYANPNGSFALDYYIVIRFTGTKNVYNFYLLLIEFSCTL